jgi:hypothetical protein
MMTIKSAFLHSSFLIVVLLLAISSFPLSSLSQEKPDRLTPPDLLHASRFSCTIVEYEAEEVFNAKIQQPEEILRYRVEPFAEYDDHRDRWELPKETMPQNRGVMRPGALGDFSSSHEAIDACSAWMKKMKASSVEEKKKHAHGSPEVKK